MTVGGSKEPEGILGTSIALEWKPSATLSPSTTSPPQHPSAFPKQEANGRPLRIWEGGVWGRGVGEGEGVLPFVPGSH